MDGMRFPVSVHLHGTLAANAQGAFALPSGMTLLAVSACGGNANDATLKIGTSDDDDGIRTATAIGDSSTPAVWDKGDFDGALVGSGQLWHGAAGTVFTWALDYDGAGGTAAQHVDILFTFVEG